MRHSSFHRTDHRPWPIPEGRWTWRQSWRDLLFAHWPISSDVLRPLVPHSLDIQEFDGTSWVGVVPFRMSGVMRRPFPDLPGISAFPEINLRLYVERDGTPGVWFLSLDAANPIAVWAAKRFFNLPYFRATILIEESKDGIAYSSRRSEPPDNIAFEARYRGISDPYEAEPGSLEHWLTERYCLYAMSPEGGLFRTDIHHQPWQLQKADVEIIRNQLSSPHGFVLDGDPVLVHFSREIHVVVWNPIPLAL